MALQTICKKCFRESEWPWLDAAKNNHLLCLKAILKRDNTWDFDKRYILLSAARHDSLECLIYLYEKMKFPYDPALKKDYNSEDDPDGEYYYDKLSDRIKAYLEEVESDWEKGIYRDRKKSKKCWKIWEQENIKFFLQWLPEEVLEDISDYFWDTP